MVWAVFVVVLVVYFKVKLRKYDKTVGYDKGYKEGYEKGFSDGVATCSNESFDDSCLVSEELTND